MVAYCTLLNRTSADAGVKNSLGIIIIIMIIIIISTERK